jgi:hypothetical protein
MILDELRSVTADIEEDVRRQAKRLRGKSPDDLIDYVENVMSIENVISFDIETTMVELKEMDLQALKSIQEKMNLIIEAMLVTGYTVNEAAKSLQKLGSSFDACAFKHNVGFGIISPSGGNGIIKSIS